jgi:hypothetical protein
MGGYSTVATNTSGLEGQLTYVKNCVDEIKALIGTGGGLPSGKPSVIQELFFQQSGAVTLNALESAAPTALYNRVVGQAFTADGSQIVKVAVLAQRTQWATKVLCSVYAVDATDMPVGSVLAQSDVTVMDDSGGWGFVPFVFSTPFKTIAGVRYFVAFSILSVDAVGISLLQLGVRVVLGSDFSVLSALSDVWAKNATGNCLSLQILGV